MNSKKTDPRKQFSMVLADYLSRLRQNRKLSLAYVASQTDMTSQAIGLYEKGKRIPSVDAVSKLARFYGVKTQDVLKVRENTILDTVKILGDDAPPAIKNEYVMLSLSSSQMAINGEPVTAEELEKATEFIKALRLKQNKTL